MTVKLKIKKSDGSDLEHRFIDQTIHHDVLESWAIDVPSDIEVELSEPVWGIVFYVGADTFDNSRLPVLKCYSEDGSYLGGDGAASPFGPQAYLNDETAPAGPFQYLVFIPGRRPFLNYIPKPIKKCIIEPRGDDVFIGRIAARFI
jgi:hypothetical protein